MRTTERSVQFRRDYKRALKGFHGATLEALLRPIIAALLADRPLDARFRDHALTGNWRGCRDCHVRPDLILIYRKIDDDRLELRRLGSHSELRL